MHSPDEEQRNILDKKWKPIHRYVHSQYWINKSNRALKKEHDIDILILGFSYTRKLDTKNPPEDLKGKTSIEVNIKLKSVDCSTGFILSTQRTGATFTHNNTKEAKKIALKRAVDEILTKAIGKKSNLNFIKKTIEQYNKHKSDKKNY